MIACSLIPVRQEDNNLMSSEAAHCHSFNALGANSAEDKLIIVLFFLAFVPLEKIYMKCQILFPGKNNNKKIFQDVCSFFSSACKVFNNDKG